MNKNMKDLLCDIMNITFYSTPSHSSSIIPCSSTNYSPKSSLQIPHQINIPKPKSRQSEVATPNSSLNVPYSGLATPKKIPTLVKESKKLGGVLNKFIDSAINPIIPLIPAGLSAPRIQINEESVFQKNKVYLEHVMVFFK